jgi:hypothetical protein
MHASAAVASLGLLLVLLASAPSRADLALEVTAEKGQYLLDEPLYVTVALRNVGARDALVVRALHPGMGLLALEVAPPGEGPHVVDPCGKFELGPGYFVRATVLLAPGDHYTGAVELTREMTPSGAQNVLRRPGRCAIRATYAIPEGLPAGPLSLRSNELSLLVSEPEGVDRQAYEALLSCPRPERGPGLWNSTPETADCFEAVVRDYPDSRYALYARLYIADARYIPGTSIHRGTVEGRAELEQAAPLYSSVADEAGATPLGVHARGMAGRAFGALGDAARAQALFEQAFVSPAATDEDRLLTLSAMRLLGQGYFQEMGGLVAQTSSQGPQLPLRRFARAMGLSVHWDASARTARVSGRGIRASLRPAAGSMVINGTARVRVPVSLKNGRTHVSPSVIAALMAEQRGRGVANALAGLLAALPRPKPG